MLGTQSGTRIVTELTGTAWRVYYSDADGNVVELPLSTTGYVLTSNGIAAAPSWQAGAVIETADIQQDFIAGENLSALRVVKGQADGTLKYCTLNVLDAGLAIGVVITSGAATETVTTILGGLIEDAGWAWNTALPIWLGADGTLTQTIPTTGYHQIIGVAQSPTAMIVKIQQPILIA